MFVLVYLNQNDGVMRFNDKKYYLSKVIIWNYNVIINGRNLYDQSVDSDIKRYGEIRKSTTGRDEGCTNGCLLD